MTSQTKDLKFFRGDYTGGEQPHIWFRKLEGMFDETTKVEAKIYKFSKFLEPGRKAETWFDALPATQKTDWEAFYVLFTTRWPKPIVVEPSRDDLMATLLSIRLEEHELGTLVGKEDEKAYAHIAWATEVRGIVEALDDAQGYLIPQVCMQLPLAVRLALPNLPAPATWDKFLESITSLPTDRIRDQQESIMRTQVPPSPTTALTSRFQTQANVSYRQPPPAYYNTNRTAPNIPTFNTPTPATPTGRGRDIPPHMPFTNRLSPQTPQTRSNPNTPNPFLTNENTLRPNSMFGTKTIPQTPMTPSPRRTPSPDPAELARRAQATELTYANTPEGLAKYSTDLAAWLTMYGQNRKPDFTTLPYPLRPGTAGLGKRECFRCGLPGHIGKECNDANPLDQREQDIRSLVSQCLYARRQEQFFRVSQISADEPGIAYDAAIYDTDNLGFDDEFEQGNGSEECP